MSCTWTVATKIKGPLDLFHIAGEELIPAVNLKVTEDPIGPEGSGVEEIDISVKGLVPGFDLNNDTNMVNNFTDLQDGGITKEGDYKIMQRFHEGESKTFNSLQTLLKSYL